MIYKTSARAVEAIKAFEGYRSHAYRCPAGVYTIGYGHVKNVRKYQTCTKAEAHTWLLYDLAEAEAAVNALDVCKTQGQFDALADFAFNLGAAALRKSTLLRKIQAQAAEAEIRAEFARWIYADGKPLDGLRRRRKWEADTYFETT